MEKCQKHGVEMVVKERAVGWGTEDKLVCPECEKEKRAENTGRDQITPSIISRGWASM